MPEHVAILRAAWRGEARRILQDTAAKTDATLVIGLDVRGGDTRRNIAWVFQPKARTPLTYVKRRLGVLLLGLGFSRRLPR